MAHDVFISHSSKDKVVADAVCATFEAQGIRCWVAPRDVPPGSNWGAAIVDAIAATRLMILIFSDHANASGQIAREVELAAGHGITIVPIRIENVLPARSLQFFLSNIHWLDALTPPLERRLQEIASRIQVILRGESAIRGEVGQSLATTARVHTKRRRWIAGAAGLALLLGLGLVSWRFWIKPQPTTQSQQPDSSVVDSNLVGNWFDIVTVVGTEMRIEFSIDSAGHYRVSRTIEQEGIVEGEGRAKIIDKRGKEIISLYVLVSRNQMRWSYPDSPSINYKRAEDRATAEQTIVGKWTATTQPLFGINWHAKLEVRPNLSFLLSFEDTDTGTLRAASNQWESNSTQGRSPLKGSYRVLTLDSFEFITFNEPTLPKLILERANGQPAK